MVQRLPGLVLGFRVYVDWVDLAFSCSVFRASLMGMGFFQGGARFENSASLAVFHPS